MVKVLGPSGKLVELRNKLGEGGEGTVWSSPLASNIAIKTYLKPMPSGQVDKLLAMASMAESRLFSAAAWPTRIVYAASGMPIGFEMPKLSGQKPFHEIIGVKSRKAAFPNANWEMLVHAAGNLARAFDVLHAKDIIVGDINSNNVVVRADACVLFIDCDSFQIRTPSRTFRCEVGVPDYQPPEFQNVAFGNADRGQAHDAFGMAVMIFQLLFVGKHPFSGRLPNPGSVAPTPGENIARGNYFYDDCARQRGLQPPPGSLSISAVTPTVAKLFERAFRGVPQDRPRAKEWIAALVELERLITTCKVDTAHRYLISIACPWCFIELQTRIVYFAAPTLLSASGEIDDSIWSTFSNIEATSLWREIASVLPPNVAFETIRAARAAPTPISERSRKRGAVFIGAMCAFVLSAVAVWFIPAIHAYEFVDVLLAAGFWMLGRPSGGIELAERKLRLHDTRDAFQRSESVWKALCDGGEFQALRQRLADVHASTIAQPLAYQTEIGRVTRSGEEKAKRQYLDSQFIRDAKIKGIGDKLATRLAAADIETALDIDNRIFTVSGIGNQKAVSLFAWRSTVEQQFRFEPKMVESLIRDLKVKHVQQRTHNRYTLMDGSKLLREVGARTESCAPEIRAKAIQERRRLDQAEADVRPFLPLIYR